MTIEDLTKILQRHSFVPAFLKIACAAALRHRLSRFSRILVHVFYQCGFNSWRRLRSEAVSTPFVS